METELLSVKDYPLNTNEILSQKDNVSLLILWTMQHRIIFATPF